MPLSERKLIGRIQRAVQRGRSRGQTSVITGIGDDCAVLQLPRGHEALITTDFSLEGVHFRREWHPADSVGHRCLTRGLSDIAAMGGEPMAAFLSLALPQELPQKWADDFLRGLLRLADRFRVVLAGGDIAQSPAGVLADIVVLGSAPQGKAIPRSGARAGDGIYVTGSLGAAVAALDRLAAGERLSPRRHPAHFYPEPRIAVGQKLRGVASAMIDISDGLSSDLDHICQESGVGAMLDGASIPVAPGTWLQHALHGGDAYELLFTASPRKRVPREIGGVLITRIGEITRQRGMWLAGDGRRMRLRPQGWEHFRTSSQ